MKLRIVSALCVVMLLAADEKKEPKFKGTAEDFVKEVLADPPAAAKKYSGKVVEIEGTVAAPDKSTPKGCFVVTGATGKFTTTSTDLICTPADGVKAPTAGQRVKLTGTVGGSINVLSIDVKECAVELLKNEAFLWRVSDGERTGQLPIQLSAVSSLAFTADGQFLVTASLQGTLMAKKSCAGFPRAEIIEYRSLGV